MDPQRVDVPPGTLDLLILTILRRGPLHGYGISQRLSSLTSNAFRLNPGSLFPALYRLEHDGKLAAVWRSTENKRKAKYYQLTASGRRYLSKEESRWDRVSVAIRCVLAGT